jgi:hypothetical protein
MAITNYVATACYLVASGLSAIFGVIYLTRSKFMPYHSKALGQEWDELTANLQVLLLALMRVCGGGLLGVGLCLAILVIVPFQSGASWAMYTIPSIGLVASLSTLYATYLVKTKTPGNPPIGTSVLAIGLFLIGFLLSLL